MFLVSLEVGGAFKNNALPYMRVGPTFRSTATTRRSVFVLDTVVPQLRQGVLYPEGMLPRLLPEARLSQRGGVPSGYSSTRLASARIRPRLCSTSTFWSPSAVPSSSTKAEQIGRDLLSRIRLGDGLFSCIYSGFCRFATPSIETQKS